jgi:hypothetical protein
MRGVTAEIPDVLVAADRPKARSALTDRLFGTELRQHVEVVVPEEEGSVPGINPRKVDLAPLVPGHSPSVLCSAMRTPPPDDTSTPGA